MPIRLGPIAGEHEGAVPGLSRREFLAVLAAGGFGALASGCARRPAGSHGNPGGWFAWLSDVHIAADPSTQLRGETPAANLRAAVADILAAEDPPRGVLIDGDLAYHDGQPGDYRTFLALVEPLRQTGIPLHLVLGNHDDRGRFRAALGPADSPLEGKQVGVVEADDLRLILLDSLQRPNVTAGVLGAPQVDWLAAQLDADRCTPTIVFVHHNLNANRSSALQDTTALLDVLGTRRQVKVVVYGHTHVWNARRLGELHAINLPAVAYRFHPKQPLGWCAFRPRPDGGELELRCIGGDRRQDGRRADLRWRA